MCNPWYTPPQIQNPFWLSVKEKEDQNLAQVVQGRTVKHGLKKEELVQRLGEVGVTAAGNYMAIQKFGLKNSTGGRKLTKNKTRVDENRKAF
jgi:hypothetical protein